MSTALKTFGVILLVLFAIIGSSLFWLPYFLTSDFARNKITTLIERETGRTVSIRGESTVSFFPDIALVVNDITLANPPAAGTQPLIKMATLRADLKLLPLLRGNVEIGSITFDQPQIIYAVDEAGKSNWTLPASVTRSGGAEPRAAGSRFSFGKIQMNGLVLNYNNARTKVVELITVDAVTLEEIPSLTGNAADQSVKAVADVTWRNEQFRLSGKVHRLAELLSQSRTTVDLSISSRLANGEYSGWIEPRPEPSFDGKLVSQAPSLRELLAFIGNRLPDGNGLGKLSIDTQLKGDLKHIDFVTNKMQLDNTNLSAKGALALNEVRPRLAADVEIDRLDIAAYLSKQAAVTRTAPVAPAGAATLDFTALRAFDGKLTLRAKEIVYQKASMNDGVMEATLNDGLLDADISKLTLYQGNALGKVRLDGRNPNAGLSGKMQLRQVLTGGMLRDFANFDKLSGKGDIDVDVTSSGNNFEMLTASLSGTTRFDIKKGRIEGFGLAGYQGIKKEDLPTGFDSILMRSVTRSGSSNIVEYERLSGLFTIDKGVARNQDLELVGSWFRVRAAGFLDLLKRTLNFKVAPQLFSGSFNIAAPPIVVAGPWTQPTPVKDKSFAVASRGGGGVARAVSGVLEGRLEELVRSRGLKSDQEIEDWLAGKQIDVSKELAAEPAPANP